MGRAAQPASAVRNSLQPACSVYDASSAPRGAPRLTITTGVPFRAARRTKRSPDITVSDDPATRSAPPVPDFASTACLVR